MENLNAEQVKKALECCKTPKCSNCEECPERQMLTGTDCLGHLIADTLALIEHQKGYMDEADQRIFELQEKIKELTEECKDFKIRAVRAENEVAKYKDRWETSRKDFKRLADEHENLHASCTEVERKCASLNDENESLKDSNEHLAVFLEEAKADTVRKMQERLKRECFVDSGWEVFQIGTIDQIAKEMLESDDG